MMDTDTLALIPGCWPPAGCCHDLTGGAPGCTTGFAAWCARPTQGVRIIDRWHRPSLLGRATRPGQFLAEQRVDIVASMPCYSAANVDKQRGDGVLT
jgi:hypothetical protein